MAEIMPDFPEFDGPEAPPEEPVLEPEIVNMPVVGTTKLSTQPIALSLVQFEHQVALMVQQAKDIVVTDEAENKKATEVVATHSKLYKRLEKSLEAAIVPYREHVNNIRNLYKTLMDQLLHESSDPRNPRGPKLKTGSIVDIKVKMGQFAQQRELERRRQEAEAREAQRKLQEQLEAEARLQREEADKKAREAAAELEKLDAAGALDEGAKAILEQTILEESKASVAPTPQAPPLVVQQRTATRTSEGSSFAKWKWVCRIVDPAKVPREFCEPVAKLLNEAVKDGVRSIAGCEITEEPEINVRS